MNSDKIDLQEVKDAKALPSPTGVALNVMRMCRNEKTSLTDLSLQIQTDPVLAGRLIQLANAGRKSGVRPIVAISEDVLLIIGVHAVRQVALGVSLINSYQSSAGHVFDYPQFWSRSLAMACVAQVIGEHAPIAPVAELFSCGLLAGIGRLGLAALRPEAYGEMLAQHSMASVAELMDLERERFGYDRVQLSVAMLEEWNIPRLFVDAVRFHKTPGLSGWNEQSRQQRLVRLLNLAGFIADIDIAPAAEKEAMMPTLFERSAAIGLDVAEITNVMQQSAKEWVGWRETQRVSRQAGAQLH